MDNFARRREYFEKIEDCHCKDDFLELTKKAKQISEWAAEQLGITDTEKEHYTKKNISKVIQENEIHNMLHRIERDLFEANITLDQDDILKIF